MRKRSLIVFLVVGLLLVGCNDPEDTTIDEDNEPQLAHASRSTYTLEQTAKEADIIANVTITDTLDVFLHESDIEYSLYQAIVNHYFYDELGYGHEITILKAGGPNWQFADDPLLEIDETYIVFLDERDSEYGKNLIITGGPQGRYYQKGDQFVRALNLDEFELSELTERELIEAINERSDTIEIDLSILD